MDFLPIFQIWDIEVLGCNIVLRQVFQVFELRF